MTSIDNARCILITGATSGIGRSLALALKALPSGPRVIGTGRRKDRLAELERAGIEAIELDLNVDAISVQKSADSWIEKYPELDAVILNAGIQREFNFKKGDVNIQGAVDEFTVNYLSIVAILSRITPYFVNLSEKQGRPTFIVPVTSGLGITPAPWVPNYSASKAALRNFSTSLKAQLLGTNVHVLEIIPPLVESELHDAEGTSEALAKIWMPLDEYTKLTVEGLRAGESYISALASLDGFNRFERPKWDSTLALMKSRGGWE